MAFVQIPPFAENLELVHSQVHPTTNDAIPVPNEPFISASPEVVDEFLSREVECKVLDELAPYFYVFAKRRSSHLDTLHEYSGTGRRVTISENPGLHLVRNYNTFYVKPIPSCLLNFAFWNTYLAPERGTRGQHAYPTSSLSINCRSALGLLRTYGHLIKHESDFRIAKDAYLLPEHISYTAFQHFIHPFRNLSDHAVSPRYQYGHIRLTRLNLAVRIVRPSSLGKMFPWSYHGLHYHSGQYLADFAAPLLFLFACFTLILSSMQVGLAAAPTGGRWTDFASASLWFSIVVILGILGMGAWVCFGVGMYILNRVIVGYRVHRRTMEKMRREGDFESVSSGAK